MSVSLKKLRKAVKVYKKAISDMKSAKISDLVGTKVRITKEYSQWLSGPQGVACYTVPGKTAPDAKDPSWKFAQHLAKNRPVGKVVAARYDDNDFTITVEFKDSKGKKKTELLGLDNIKEV